MGGGGLSGQGSKGNSVGSAGASNYTGDGKGGQVNMDHVGGTSGNVLRQINGRWTAVNKATGMPAGVHTTNQLLPNGYSVAKPKVTPASLAQVKAGIPVPGMTPQMLAQIQAFLDQVPTAGVKTINQQLRKTIYDRMPEYDQLPGQNQPWSPPNPQIGNNLVQRVHSMNPMDSSKAGVGGGWGGGMGGAW